MTEFRHQWLDRRDYLKAVGAAASLPILGAAATRATSSGDDATPASRSETLAQTDSTTSTVPRDDYDTVVNVKEVGGDPTGSEPINPVLEEHGRGDDTLLYFPPGRYLMDRQFRFSGFTNYGIYGEDATIVPAPYHKFEGPEYRLFKLGTDYAPGDGLLFQGLTIDQQADATGVRTVQAQVSTRLRVRDIHIVGEHDTGTFGPGLFDVLDPDGWGVVERFRAPDGGAFTNNTPGSIDTGPTGIIVSPAHDGKLWFRDCELGGFPDNGLYDSIGAGRVIVEGGVYRNSNSASIRIGGDDSAIIGARVIVDENRPEDQNQRGIRLDHGDNLLVKDVNVELVRPNGHAITLKGTGPVGGVDSVRIVDSTVQIDNQPSHGIVVYDGAGPTDIVNTQVTINSAGNAILVSEGTRSSSGRVFCQNVTITGTASGTGAGTPSGVTATTASSGASTSTSQVRTTGAPSNSAATTAPSRSPRSRRATTPSSTTPTAPGSSARSRTPTTATRRSNSTTATATSNSWTTRSSVVFSTRGPRTS
ncbi:right-handed parallel beta-helix repeat-containing protein [Halobacteriaceae archaeon GCM10025711]